MATVCLNMIVKNESKNIVRFLRSVVEYIDHYVICDTGSTDNTIQCIEEFFQLQLGLRPITGHVVQEPFRNFGHTRTHSFQQAKQLFPAADYFLFLDADMLFRCTLPPQDFKQGLLNGANDVLMVFQGSDNFATKNARICRGGDFGQKCEYIGVTHEYLSYPAGTKLVTLPSSEVFIVDIGDGGCKADKFQRDIRLLEEDFVRDPTNGRTLFYLGNSYRDDGQHLKAIEIYKLKLLMAEKRKTEWFEEVWYSLYSLGHCYRHLKRPDKSIHYWMEAFKHNPKRVENLYEICKEYRIQGKAELAYEIYMWAKRIATAVPLEKMDFLFLQRDVYEWKLDYELSIVGYYYNPLQVSLMHSSMTLLSKPAVQRHSEYRNILGNYKFYTETFPRAEHSTAIGTALNKLTIPATLPAREKDVGQFVSSTPSLVVHQGQVYVNVRYVNYSIDSAGGYVNESAIITRNVMYNVYTGQSNEWEVVPLLGTHYQGIEDVRFLSQDGVMYYNGNRGVPPENKFQIEHGVVDLFSGGESQGKLLASPINHAVEKNWAFFGPKRNVVYKWFPLTIGEIDPVSQEYKTTLIQTEGVPAFFHDLRGSTNGVVVGDEIWFLCHLVSYEDRRYYYHLFVVLDSVTLTWKRYSSMYKLVQKTNPVEYCLGMLYDKDIHGNGQMILGLSVLDRTTEFLAVDLTKLIWWKNKDLGV